MEVSFIKVPLRSCSVVGEFGLILIKTSRVHQKVFLCITFLWKDYTFLMSKNIFWIIYSLHGKMLSRDDNFIFVLCRENTLP